MRKLSVEVQEESGRAGGHAVIRLMGLHSLPDGVTYRIRPVDTALQSDTAGHWIEGDRIPLATRITTDGAELVVGPEIVENPAFLPGTLAVIELAKCGVRGEFLWPRISPLVRPKRRHLIAIKSPRQQVAEPVSEILFDEAADASSHIDPLPIVTPSAEPLPDLIDWTPLASAVENERGEAGPAATNSAGFVTALTAAPGNTAATPSEFAAGSTHGAVEPGTPDRTHAATFAQAARSGLPHWPIAAAVVGVSVLTCLATYSLTGRPFPATRPDVTSLAPLLSVGALSPQGLDTTAAPLQKLLEDADARLNGPETTRDKAEAAFLLRRYLATTLGDERTLWALTQLGTVYAEPANGALPDYANARRLWELSGSLGDPVAMCFVAALHEHGLGVRADRESALGWYQRSKSAGGCRNVDAAIERVKLKK